MKNFKKQAIPAIFMLLMAIISLTGVTFAWFSDAKDASVKNININITESSGVAISLEGKGDYAKYVDLDTATSGETLSPVSAWFENKNRQENVYTKLETTEFTAGVKYYEYNGNTYTETLDSAYQTGKDYYYISTPEQNIVLPNWFVASKGNGAGKLSSTSAYTGDTNSKGYMTISLFFETLSGAKEVYFLGNGISVVHDYNSDKTAITTDSRGALRIAFVVYETSSAKQDKDAYTKIMRTVIVEPFATEHAPSRGAVDAVAETYYAITGAYTSNISEYDEVDTDDTSTKADFDAIAKYNPLFYLNGTVYVEATEFSMEEARSVVSEETWETAKNGSFDEKIYTKNSSGEYVEATTYTAAVEGSNPVPQPTYYVQRQFYVEKKPEINQKPVDTSDSSIGTIYKECETYKTTDHKLEESATTSGGVGSLFTIGQGYTRVDMYVWLEGQDMDCIDAITLEDIIMNMNLFCLDEGK